MRGAKGRGNLLRLLYFVRNDSLRHVNIFKPFTRAGLISAVIGMKQPGQGTIYLQQTLHFLAPVKVGDVVTASVEVIDLLEKHRVRLKTQCVKQDGVVVLDGEALVIAPAQ